MDLIECHTSIFSHRPPYCGTYGFPSDRSPRKERARAPVCKLLVLLPWVSKGWRVTSSITKYQWLNGQILSLQVTLWTSGKQKSHGKSLPTGTSPAGIKPPLQVIIMNQEASSSWFQPQSPPRKITHSCHLVRLLLHPGIHFMPSSTQRQEPWRAARTCLQQ